MAFKKYYPAIHKHLSQFKPQLANRNKAETGIRYEWYALQRWGADYWQEFELPKIVTGRFMDKPTFAYEADGQYNNNANSFIAGATLDLVGILNSSVSWYFLRKTCTDLQNGFIQAHNENIAAIPIPAATATEKQACETLSSALIALHRPEAAALANRSLMVAYLEQWLNGLVYELFFPDELHARNLHLFATTAEIPLPVPGTPDYLERLQACFQRTYDVNHPLRAMLFSLRSLETVRIIEGEA